MTSNEALKPCPFCGDPMLTHSVEGRLQGFTHTPEATEKAVCYLRHTYYAGEQVDWWNTRSTDTPVCASTEERARVAYKLRLIHEDWVKGIEPSRRTIRAIVEAADILAASQAPETIERLREALLANRRTLASAIHLLDDCEITHPLRWHDALDKADAALSSIPEPLIMPLEGE